MARFFRKRKDRPERSNSTPIGNAISKTLEEIGLAHKIKQYQIVDAWASIVGEKIARETEAESIKERKLIVKVKHPTWRNELIFLKQEIISKINKVFGENLINDIIFK